jgi:hypothetical protein
MPASPATGLPPFLQVALTTARPFLARALVTVPPAVLAADLTAWARAHLTVGEQTALQELAAILATRPPG